MSKIFKTLFGILIAFIPFQAYVQEIMSENIADLEGAIEIEREGRYVINFSGWAGKVNDFNNTQLASKIKEKNSIFLIKHCFTKEDFTFKIDYNKPTLQLAVFKFKYQNVKKNLNLNDMDLLYFSDEARESYSNMGDSEEDYKLPPLECSEDDAFLVVINNIKNNYNSVEVNFKDNITDYEVLRKSRTKIYDDRLPDDPTKIVVKVVDEENGLPIISNINLISKKKSALFIASEIILGEDSKTKMQIQCDAEGYLFKDTAVKLIDVTADTIIIKLKSVSVGKVFKIENIEFQSGTAQIVSSAHKILRRFKDFLFLNSTVHIEIQGYVNGDSSKEKKSIKLSKLRAMTIRNYLINSGINKNRMTIKGFGSTKPIYPAPKTEEEHQANRRVEIKIIH